MNLRILKKLSKRVAPVLPLLDDAREQFLAERGENYHEAGVWIERKHCERHRSLHEDPFGKCTVVRKARDGDGFIHIRQPYHPLKGTPMIGGMVGYYEPEWEERCTWAIFTMLCHDHYTDWGGGPLDEDGCPRPVALRHFRTTRDYLAAIPDLIEVMQAVAERRRERAVRTKTRLDEILAQLVAQEAA